MIPYFRYTFIPIGPVRIQVWGLMVASGIIVATLLGRREAKRRGLDPELFVDFGTWIMVSALIVARLFHAFAYEPAAYLADPLRILRVWEGGMSSFGGFLGAAIGALLFARKRKLDFHAYADAACYAFPLGYGIGRIGCFLIHDHPGTLSHSLLAVQYPGGARLDHGLLLSLVGFALFALFTFLNRRREADRRASGRFLPLLMVFYGAIRFVLDFYRAYDLPGSDTRYLALTPAQYGSLLLVAAGAWLFYGLRKTGAARP
ncbi:MAG TPA: prolipoprotein diacylglyceryl transferase [Candidatus Eisenbacteria bacterium]|nr:prolipoprotein diacylglyceryl transferase [Candidatus Eisenbacteria bacterium]